MGNNSVCPSAVCVPPKTKAPCFFGGQEYASSTAETMCKFKLFSLGRRTLCTIPSNTSGWVQGSPETPNKANPTSPGVTVSFLMGILLFAYWSSSSRTDDVWCSWNRAGLVPHPGRRGCSSPADILHLVGLCLPLAAARGKKKGKQEEKTGRCYKYS